MWSQLRQTLLATMDKELKDRFDRVSFKMLYYRIQLIRWIDRKGNTLLHLNNIFWTGMLDTHFTKSTESYFWNLVIFYKELLLNALTIGVENLHLDLDCTIHFMTSNSDSRLKVKLLVRRLALMCNNVTILHSNFVLNVKC